MTKFSSINIKFALVMSAFFVLFKTTNTFSQGWELFPGSEKAEYDEKTGLHRLKGPVNFTYQGNIVYCDSARYYDKKNMIYGYGHVQINKKDTLNLYCDSLIYNGNTEVAQLLGNVRVRDQDYKISTNRMDYDMKNGVGIYRTGGKIESLTSSEVLTSRIGYFYPNSKNLFFKGKVTYKSPEYTVTTDTLRYVYSTKTAYFFGPTKIKGTDMYVECNKGSMQLEKSIGDFEGNAKIIKDGKEITGDKLNYNKGTGIAKGAGNVCVNDTAAKQAMFGEKMMFYEKTGYSYLTGNSLVERYFEKDTMKIHADTLHYYQDTTNTGLLIRGAKNVRINKGQLIGIADSIAYDMVLDLIELHQNPILWAKNGELKADTMRVFLSDSTVKYAEIRSNSTFVAQLDSGKFYNQIGGTNILCFFKNEEVNFVKVQKNARTIYYPEEETKNDTIHEIKRIGMMRMYSKDMHVYLDSGEVSKITYLQKPEGAFYPFESLTEESKYIENFEWKGSLKPVIDSTFSLDKQINFPDSMKTEPTELLPLDLEKKTNSTNKKLKINIPVKPPIKEN